MPAPQCINSPVSAASLQKTGILLSLAGDFWVFAAQKVRSFVCKTIADEKSPHLAGLSHRGENILQNRGSLADHPGIELVPDSKKPFEMSGEYRPIFGNRR
jgi:hypothetical protein